MDVLGGEHRVELEAHAEVVEHVAGLDGALEGSRETAEGVVGGRGAAVEGHRHHRDAGILHGLDPVTREQWGHRGRDRHVQTLADAVLDEVDEVGTLEAVTTGEDEHRVGTLVARQLVDEFVALGVRQLAGGGVVLGFGAAVLADQGAGAGDLPDDDEGLVVEVVLDLADERAVAGMAARMSTWVATGMPGRMTRGRTRMSGLPWPLGMISGGGHFSSSFEVI